MTQQIYEITRKKEALTGKFKVRPQTSDEKAILEVWKKNSYQRKGFHVAPGERWLDLGSNIGAFSVYAALKGCTIKAYEADETNARATTDNLWLNGLQGEVTRAAIVHDDYPAENVRFYVNSRPMALRRHSIYQPKKNFQEIIVPAIRFRQLPLGQTDGIKMNIEGAEIELLERATDFGSVRKLVFEYSYDKDPSLKRFLQLLAKLQRHFKSVEIQKKVPPHTELWTFYPPNNYVYCER